MFTDRIVRQLGADPRVHTAIGVGYGLEWFAMVSFGIDDIRKIDEGRRKDTAKSARMRAPAAAVRGLGEAG